MRSTNHAPWQAGPVSTTAHIAFAALVVLAVDATFLWPLAAYRGVALVITLVPALLAVRVIRALPHSLDHAAIAFAAAWVSAMVALTTGDNHYGGAIIVALAVAVVASGLGLAALTVEWARARQRQPAGISLTRSSEQSIAVIRQR